MARGVLAAAPGAEILRAPMADGGEGFTQALVDLTGGSLHPVDVTGPAGDPVSAHIGMLGGSHIGTGVLEIASAAGLRQLPPEKRDPLRTTSYGVGELIRATLDLGAKRLLVGCGDSGVNDGGSGLAEALGVRLLNQHSQPIGRGGLALTELAEIDLSQRDPRLASIVIDVAVNWENMLLGSRGVARIYGPQKGASRAAVSQLQAGLYNLARVIREDLGIDVRTMKGAGASGGIGAGLYALIGARLFPRFEILSRFLNVDELIADADLVLTAEGTIDRQTALGKLPGEIARRAKLHGVPVVALVGSIGDGADIMHAAGIDAYFSIMTRPYSLPEAMVHAKELVAKTTEQIIRLALVKIE